jgi:hypothetical protein
LSSGVLVLGADGFAHVCGKAGVSPGEELSDELVGDGVAVEEAGEEPLAQEAHEEGGVPFRHGEEAAVRGEAAVGSEQIEMGVPRGGPGELGQEIAPTANERPQQTRDGHDVTVRDGSEQLVA